MNRQERFAAHNVWVPPEYRPDPKSHLNNPRDAYHYEWTLKLCYEKCGGKIDSILDVGCWDAWLAFLMIKQGFKVHGVELIPGLADAAKKYAQENQVPKNDFDIYTGFLDEIAIPEQYDLVLCYETLEHIEPIDTYIKKIDDLATMLVAISLPDQKHEDNQPQHLWTPTEKLIKEIWGHKKNFELSYKTYPGSNIPANWFISYEK